MRTFYIGNNKVTQDGPGYIIAELGTNHGGDVAVAHKMIEEAARCGVNAVKLQKRTNAKIFTRQLYNQPYESEAAYGPTYGLHREALELDYGEFCSLQKHAKDKGLDFVATGFDPDAVDMLVDIGVDALKIASGDANNIPLIEYVARRTTLPMIVSLGGLNMEGVDRVVEAMWYPVQQQAALLQCTAAYPVTAEDLRLGVIRKLLDEYPFIVGLSDHYSGIVPGGVAFALGARIFEKHFTLDRSSRGTDHAFSMEPHGMAEYVSHLRAAYEALLCDDKEPLPCEEKPLRKMGKKLVAARRLSSGINLEKDDIAIKSPNDGLPPWMLDDAVGRYLTEPLDEDQNIEEGWA